MNKTALLAMTLLLSACASTSTTTTAMATPPEARKPSSDEALTIEGTWTGKARFYRFNEQLYPLVCKNTILEAQATGQPCESNSGAGKFVNIKMKCVDDLLSAKGQATFNQNVTICQTTQQLKRPSDGSSFWNTMLGTDRKSGEAPGYRLLANIMEQSTENLRDVPASNTGKVIWFNYVNSGIGGNSVYTLEASFYKPAN